MVERYFPLEEYEARWSKVEDEMKKKGLDAAIVWSRSAGTHDGCADALYLANFYSTNSGTQPDSTKHHGIGFNAVLLQIGEEPELICDEPPPEHLVATTRHRWSLNPIQAAMDAVRERNIGGKVAFCGTELFPMKYWAELKAGLPNIDWQFEDHLTENARLIKSPRELDAFREGGEIVTGALGLLIGGLVAGKSEAEAAADAVAEVTRQGGSVFMMPVNHGELIEFFCRNPLDGYSTDVPEQGDLVRGWVYGPIWQGYWIDPGRTAVCGGKPSPEQKELVEACGGLITELAEMIKPGVRVGDVARRGNEIEAEFGGTLDQAHQKWPLFGHGNGLFWEPPWLAEDLGHEDLVYREGMVASTEAFLSREGVGSAGFEQNFIVTADGIEYITNTPMYWWD